MRPPPQQRDPVAQQHRLLRIVGHDDRRRMRFAQHGQRFRRAPSRASARRGSKTAHRAQDAGPRRHAARQRQPLLLAAGKPVRIVVFALGQPDPLQRRPRLGQRRGPSERLQPEDHIPQQGQMRKQRKILKHQADAAPIGRQMDARARDDPVVDADVPPSIALDAGRRPQDRRLARAGLAQQADDLAGRRGRAELVEHHPPPSVTSTSVKAERRSEADPCRPARPPVGRPLPRVELIAPRPGPR